MAAGGSKMPLRKPLRKRVDDVLVASRQRHPCRVDSPLPSSQLATDVLRHLGRGCTVCGELATDEGHESVGTRRPPARRSRGR